MIREYSAYPLYMQPRTFRLMNEVWPLPRPQPQRALAEDSGLLGVRSRAPAYHHWAGW